MITVRPYTAEDRAAWNEFNRTARNGHFLFDRDFMEYHADRFTDASVMVFAEGELAGIMPANRRDDTIHSHQGLTFGGLVTSRANTPRTLAMLDAVRDFYRAAGARRLVYKALPGIYHEVPAAEDGYWLYRNGAVLSRRDITTTIDYRQPPYRSSRRQRGIKKAAKAGLVFGPSQNWQQFWDILSGVLASRHEVKPVHSVPEIMMLAEKLPEQIGLYTAEKDGEVLAGVVMFITKHVAHAQYISASEAGKDCGALDGLLDHLIERYRPTHRSFDFGISTFDAGRQLNDGLITQKEEFGGGAVLHDVYELGLG